MTPRAPAWWRHTPAHRGEFSASSPPSGEPLQGTPRGAGAGAGCATPPLRRLASPLRPPKPPLDARSSPLPHGPPLRAPPADSPQRHGTALGQPPRAPPPPEPAPGWASCGSTPGSGQPPRRACRGLSPQLPTQEGGATAHGPPRFSAVACADTARGALSLRLAADADVSEHALLWQALSAISSRAEWEQTQRVFRMRHGTFHGGDLRRAIGAELGPEGVTYARRLLADSGIDWEGPQMPKLFLRPSAKTQPPPEPPRPAPAAAPALADGDGRPASPGLDLLHQSSPRRLRGLGMLRRARGAEAEAWELDAELSELRGMFHKEWQEAREEMKQEIRELRERLAAAEEQLRLRGGGAPADAGDDDEQNLVRRLEDADRGAERLRSELQRRRSSRASVQRSESRRSGGTQASGEVRGALRVDNVVLSEIPEDALEPFREGLRSDIAEMHRHPLARTFIEQLVEGSVIAEYRLTAVDVASARAAAEHARAALATGEVPLPAAAAALRRHTALPLPFGLTANCPASWVRCMADSVPPAELQRGIHSPDPTPLDRPRGASPELDAYEEEVQRSLSCASSFRQNALCSAEKLREQLEREERDLQQYERRQSAARECRRQESERNRQAVRNTMDEASLQRLQSGEGGGLSRHSSGRGRSDSAAAARARAERELEDMRAKLESAQQELQAKEQEAEAEAARRADALAQVLQGGAGGPAEALAHLSEIEEQLDWQQTAEAFRRRHSRTSGGSLLGALRQMLTADEWQAAEEMLEGAGVRLTEAERDTVASENQRLKAEVAELRREVSRRGSDLGAAARSRAGSTVAHSREAAALRHELAAVRGQLAEADGAEEQDAAARVRGAEAAAQAADQLQRSLSARSGGGMGDPRPSALAGAGGRPRRASIARRASISPETLRKTSSPSLLGSRRDSAPMVRRASSRVSAAGQRTSPRSPSSPEGPLLTSSRRGSARSRASAEGGSPPRRDSMAQRSRRGSLTRSPSRGAASPSRQGTLSRQPSKASSAKPEGLASSRKQSEGMPHMNTGDPGAITDAPAAAKGGSVCGGLSRQPSSVMRRNSTARRSLQGTPPELAKQGSSATLQKRESAAALKKEPSSASQQKQGSSATLKKEPSQAELQASRKGSQKSVKSEGGAAPPGGSAAGSRKGSAPDEQGDAEGGTAPEEPPAEEPPPADAPAAPAEGTPDGPDKPFSFGDPPSAADEPEESPEDFMARCEFTLTVFEQRHPGNPVNFDEKLGALQEKQQTLDEVMGELCGAAQDGAVSDWQGRHPVALARYLLEEFYSRFDPESAAQVEDIVGKIASKESTLAKEVERLCGEHAEKGAVLEEWTGPFPAALHPQGISDQMPDESPEFRQNYMAKFFEELVAQLAGDKMPAPEALEAAIGAKAEASGEKPLREVFEKELFPEFGIPPDDPLTWGFMLYLRFPASKIHEDMLARMEKFVQGLPDIPPEEKEHLLEEDRQHLEQIVLEFGNDDQLWGYIWQKYGVPPDTLPPKSTLEGAPDPVPPPQPELREDQVRMTLDAIFLSYDPENPEAMEQVQPLVEQIMGGQAPYHDIVAGVLAKFREGGIEVEDAMWLEDFSGEPDHWSEGVTNFVLDSFYGVIGAEDGPEKVPAHMQAIAEQQVSAFDLLSQLCEQHQQPRELWMGDYPQGCQGEEGEGGEGG
eukprot:TRINITY_DN7682_c0_g1_i3.p1 TRINITY_DN7682_c0_g1~~TRINITY_DN7682_c0_g1_i3.p1  ORF type:complete len:1810 (+),score=445.12 TRINITY_DN7682_c0_g1_i3:417-5432(+)